jgi:hypothetical protein
MPPEIVVWAKRPLNVRQRKRRNCIFIKNLVCSIYDYENITD